jgi:hypothetical protein
MSGFLNSLRADLTDRRVLPMVLLLGVALLAALAFLFLGGGSSSSGPLAPLPAAAPVTTASNGIAVSEVSMNPNAAIAETAGGAPTHAGAVKDPFKQLASPTSPTSSPASPSGSGESSASPGSSSSSSGPSSSESGSSQGSSSGGEPSRGGSSGEQGKKPSHAKTVYRVTAQFGLAPTKPGGPAQLKRYEHIRRLTPLPSASAPLVVFAGVSADGKEAMFQIVGELLPNGPGKCSPSSSQCQTISLRPGQTEQLETVPADESQSPTVYELQVLAISANKVPAHKGESHKGE